MLRPKRWGRRRIWVLVSLAILAPLALSVVMGAVLLGRLARDLPPVEALALQRPSQTTILYSSDGVVLAKLFEENRTVVPLAEVPRSLRLATIAIEDHRFFEHRGVDWRGIARALVTDVRGRRMAQGGSTITQQLVRNVYLGPEKTLARKIREAMLAVRVERRYSKTQILQMYLNQVYYGSRSFGVQAASRSYFAKPVSRLTLGEAALVAGLAQRPGSDDPYKDPEAARQRRDVVLKRMADLGYITTAQAHAGMHEPLRLAYKGRPPLLARRAPYFVDYVVKDLEDRFGMAAVYRDGLRVQTTLNLRAQQAAERAVRVGMGRAFGRRPTEAALVAVDPRTGYIRAMVGGRDYRRSSFNRAAQAKRQPGSTFKPFVYAAALNAGMSPKDYITDEPIRFEHLDNWRPRNYDRRWHGRMTLTQALAQSVNIPAVKLIDMLGPDTVADLAQSAGIKSPLGSNLSLALGTSEVTPLEMAGAYGTFANKGVHVEPFAVVSVRDSRGTLLYSHVPEEVDVLDPGVAARLDGMLRAVVENGTGRPAGVIPGARGKTGTTDRRHDAWFVGYTPDLVAAVWVGNDQPSRIPGITGSGTCAPIWSSFMHFALRVLPVQPPPRPVPTPRILVAEAPSHVVATVHNEVAASTISCKVCMESGLLAAPDCPIIERESFTAGTEPRVVCGVHGGSSGTVVRVGRLGSTVAYEHTGAAVVLCAETGGVAGPMCPNTVTRSLRDGSDLPPACTEHVARRASLAPTY